MSVIGFTSLTRSLKTCKSWLSPLRNWEGLIHYYNNGPVDERLRSLFCDDGTCLEEDTNESAVREIRGRWFGYTLASIVVVVSLGLLAWTIWYRKARVVRASQPIFLILILSGASVLGSSLYPLGMDGCDDGDDDRNPCDSACMAAPWLSILGWTMLFSGIYAKLRRVRIVVENAQRFRRVTIGYRDVIRPFLIMFVLNFTALLLSTIFFPLQWKTTTHESEDESATSSPSSSSSSSSSSSRYGTCAFNDGIEDTIGTVVFGLLTLGNILALVLALVEAYRGRNIIVEYNESRYILMASVCILQTLLVGIPVLYLLDDQEQSLTYFIHSTITFTVCVSILLFLFVPKIVAQHHNNSPSRRGSPTSVTAGLSIQKRLGTSSILQTQLNAFKAKIEQLELLLIADGIDASMYFGRVGLRNTVTPTSPESVAVTSTAIGLDETTIVVGQESTNCQAGECVMQRQIQEPQQVLSSTVCADDHNNGGDDIVGSSSDSHITNDR